MKKINIKTFKTSELNIDFSNINEICVEDNAFDEGAFGKIYNCISINNNTNLGKSQAIKIFETDGEIAKLSFQTIQSLQNKIIQYNAIAKTDAKKKSIQNIPALNALPQFSFEGTINGKSIFGYSASFLSNTEYMLFDNIFNEADVDKRKAYKKQYYSKSIESKLQYMFSLSEGINLLQTELYFIHADLNPKNIFISNQKNECVIIDYESGAVTDSEHKEALVFGKLGEFLAPEIYEQLINQKNNNKIKVKHTTDNWALAVMNHYLIFPAHPLFFLINTSKDTIEDYLNYHNFPSVTEKYAYFNKNYTQQYKSYELYFKELDSLIQKAFTQTISKGWDNPEQRLTPFQWQNLIQQIIPKNIAEQNNIKIQQNINQNNIKQVQNNSKQVQNIVQDNDNAELKSIKNELKQLKKEHQKVKQDVKNSNEIITQLQNEQMEKDKELRKAQNEINTLKAQLKIKDSFLEKLKKNSSSLLIITFACFIAVFLFFYNDYNTNKEPIREDNNAEETNILQMIEDEKKEFEKQKEKYINSSTKPNADTIRLQTFLEYTNLNIGGVEADIYDYKNKHNDLNILKTNFEKRKKEQDSLFAIFNQLP